MSWVNTWLFVSLFERFVTVAKQDKFDNGLFTKRSRAANNGFGALVFSVKTCANDKHIP